MSNLETAKIAIEAELAHVKQGLTFYQARIESLEKTLLQLSNIGADSTETPSATVATPAKRGPKPGAKKVAKVAKSVESAGADASEKSVKPAKKSKSAKAGGSGLPFTGGDFWPNLVTTEPQSTSEILNAAIASLGFKPTKVQSQKLAGRQTFAINALVKAGTIKDSGKGRERRFFKA